MGARQQPRIAQIAQIAADRLHGNAKARGQIIDTDPARLSGKIEDVGLARAEAHESSIAMSLPEKDRMNSKTNEHKN